MLEVANEFAIGSKDLDEAGAVASDRIVPWPILLGVGDEEAAADFLYIERRETLWDAVSAAVVAIAGGFERIIIEVHAFEVRVVDFHFGGTEIGDIEEFVAVDLAGRGAFVDGAVRGPVVGIIHFELCAHPSGPGGDGSVFCREDEMRGFASFQKKISRAAIEDNSGWGRLRARRESRRRDDDDSIAVYWDDLPGAIVKSGSTGVVIGDPPGATRAARESPGSF